MHTMSVHEKYYTLLKHGHKTIELRLFDNKRKSIKIGDIIKFCNISDNTDNFQAIVVHLYKAENFEKLCDIIDSAKAGFDNKDILIQVMQEFYPLDKQNEVGVIGIEVITAY